MNRVVRRCFPMGIDALTGKDYSHPKDWLEEKLEKVAAYFGVDCLNFLILSIHLFKSAHRVATSSYRSKWAEISKAISVSKSLGLWKLENKDQTEAGK